jgi:hypothetical protein
MKTGVIAFVILLCVFFSAMTLFAEKEKLSMSEDKLRALSVAESFVAVKYPEFDKSGKQIVIQSVGDQWEITYKLPEDMIGGAPFVMVNKQSGEVTSSYQTQ